MSNTIRKTFRLALAAIAMVAFVSCSSSDDEEAAATTYTSLSDALGVAVDSGSARLDALNQNVTVCMKEAGFDYKSWSSQNLDVAVGSPSLAADPLEHARTSGFGVSNRVEQGSIELSLGADPNAELLSAMTPGELQAWTIALEGDLSGGGPGDGCMQRAQEEVFGVYSRLEVLSVELDELEARIESDPRLIQFQNDWRDCVAERGFLFETPNAMIEAVMDRISIDGFEIGSLDPPSASQLADIRAYEIQLATADAECTMDLGDVYAKVSADLEADFVEEYAQTLDEVRTG